MARFFIDRPVFAMVIAIVIVILGCVAIPSLPIASYPQVVPPQIQVTATYLGGNAQDLEKTVAQPIEEQLVGLDGMLYYQSMSSNNGQLTVNVTFKLGTNPDIAAVQTQNRVSLALPRLPPEVQRQGVNVKKVSSAFLMAVSLVSPDNRYDSQFLTNYAQINLVNQLGSLNGVGEARLGSQDLYSMRVWIDPDRLTEFNLTATDVSNAVASQNRQNPAGALGEAPAPKGTEIQYSVSAPGRLIDPKQFEDIVLRATSDASLLKIKDVGRVELGSQTYSGFSRLNGKAASNVIIYLAPGANAVKTAESVMKMVEEAKRNFPAGIDYVVPYNSTMFVKAAIEDVVKTLLEAIGLVILVVFLFLQNWRATIIPLLTVPVSIIGTFALFPLLGFSINITSMFGLVLAIGIVVDDAIVVVEAVQHHIDEGMKARDATILAMDEVSGPVVAIAFILAAVFVPVAFIGGISGEIFKQFALTIAVSVLISALNALTLSPALASILLRPSEQNKSFLTPIFNGFNTGFGYTNKKYTSFVSFLIRRSFIAVTTLIVVIAATGILFKALPTGFLPDEDQGAFFTSIRLPDGASTERTDRVVQKIEAILSKLDGVDRYFVIGGTDIATGTSNSNVATVITTLKPWDERRAPELQLTAILGKAQKQFAKVNEARIFPFGLPPILGLSVTGGFQFMLEDRAGGSIESLAAVADQIVAACKKRPELANIQNTFRSSVPTYIVDVDNDKMQTLGISPTESYNTLQTFLGGLYVNDFNVFGRTW
ncbi:MAG: efflux RND transporter permease subunit, partial [Leptolyngbya sp.]|nr:efflux RND transporter permease subunit [Candidatus Melainabacteria bacterium]